MPLLVNRYKKLKILFFLFACLPGCESIQAQDLANFGRNKVQYENFDFQILKTEHFEIYHYLKDPDTRQELIRILEKWYNKYAQLLSYSYSSLQKVIVYANQPDFQQTNVIAGLIPEEVGGVTESLADRIVLPLTGFHQSTEHVLAHELTHAFLFHMYESSGIHGYAAQLPLWFVEGMAEFFSIGEKDTLTSIWLKDAVLNNNVPSLQELSNNQSYFPYRFGHAVWAYLVGRYGRDKVRPLLDALDAESLDSALEKVFNIEFKTLSNQWQEEVKAKYQPLLANTQNAEQIGRKLTTGKTTINIAPALSPDGEYLACYSQINLFTIDLYLIDTHTGKTIKKLASNNTDINFDALRFTDSAGTWSPDSKKFAFVVFDNGNNRIAIMDPATCKIIEQLPVTDIDAIYGINWSPDGKRLVFVGIKESISNLYEYEIKSKTTTPLTTGHYSVMHPVYAPDGQTIAFVTDRKDKIYAAGNPSNRYALQESNASANKSDATPLPPSAETGLDAYGSMKLALLDRKTKNIKLLYFAEGISHTNPQFSPDEKSLFFVSDALGSTDLYRYSFETLSFYKLTNLATGITGLTLFSPALSMAGHTGQIAFSVLEQRAYHIYLLSSTNHEGQLFEPGPGQEEQRQKNICLPSWNIQAGQYLFPSHSELSTEDPVPLTTHKYFPYLQLISISQLIAGISISSSGFSLAAGANMFLEDLLGNHELFLAFLLSNDFKESQADILYYYLKARWNFGVHISHTPFFSLELKPLDTSKDKISFLQKRLFQEQLDLLFQYPFSQYRRFELSTGYAFIYYDDQAERIYLKKGIIDKVETVNASDTRPPAHLFQNGLAYVGDYSFFGFTEPVSGYRYRFELNPTFGSLFFTSISADFRYYAFFHPVTLAFRIFHSGRYLKDAESGYLFPFFLGNSDFVRGYNISLLDAGVCSGNESIDKCPHFQKLFGSKIATLRTEFRLPLVGNATLGLINYPYIPISLALFFDAGVAWSENTSPVWKISGSTDEQVPIFSTGLAIRMNLAGLLVFQFYLAYPFQSPARGLQFNFLIEPGW